MVLRDKKNVLIIALLVAVVFMSVGYAVLSAQVEVNGTTTIKDAVWNVRINDIRPTAVSGTGQSNLAEIKNSVSASFSATLKAPGDSVTYTVTVENAGTIDVSLDSIVTNPVDYDKGENIVYSIIGINAGDLLVSGDVVTFEVIAEFNENATSIPTEQVTRDLSLSLNYVQVR